MSYRKIQELFSIKMIKFFSKSFKQTPKLPIFHFLKKNFFKLGDFSSEKINIQNFPQKRIKPT